MGITSFLWQPPEIPWKSDWRLDFERRSREEARKPRAIIKATQIQARQENTLKPVRPPTKAGSRYRRVIPKTFCGGCQKGFRRQTKRGMCQKCLRNRPKCACGRTIYQGIEGNQCKECYHKAQARKCVLCSNLLNASNEYGLCKPHYCKYRRMIHQGELIKCADPECNSLVRPSNLVGRCRQHSRKFYAARAKANMREKRKCK